MLRSRTCHMNGSNFKVYDTADAFTILQRPNKSQLQIMSRFPEQIQFESCRNLGSCIQKGKGLGCTLDAVKKTENETTNLDLSFWPFWGKLSGSRLRLCVCILRNAASIQGLDRISSVCRGCRQRSGADLRCVWNRPAAWRSHDRLSALDLQGPLFCPWWKGTGTKWLGNWH